MHNMLSTELAVLPSLIRYHMITRPSSTMFICTSSPEQEPIIITHYEFGRACERLAQLVKPRAVSSQQGEVIALIANCDTLLYHAAIAGCSWSGFTVFPISPRNTPAAIAHLLHEVSSSRVLTTKSAFASLIDDVSTEMDKLGVEVIFEDLPSLSDVFPSLGKESPPEYIEAMVIPKRVSYAKGVEVYIHSSGSTAMPKSIPYSHDFLEKSRHMYFYSEFLQAPEDMVLSTAMLPGFHCMGFLFQLVFPLWTSRSVALFRPQYPDPPILPTPSTLIDSLITSKAQAAFVVPAFLEVWLHQPSAVKVLKSLEVIGYGGGSLALEVGEALVDLGVPIVPVYGLTEAGSVTRFYGISRAPCDWAWLQFPEDMAMQWCDHGDGMQELQLLADETHGLALQNLPGLSGCATKDLWIKHPTEELWRPIGRVDDVIVMANGEKAVPGPLEGVLMTSPLVRGVLAFGRERSQLGVLVELAHNTELTDNFAVAALRNTLWPYLEAANLEVPAFARIYKEMIIFTDSAKPLVRSPKGTITRKATIAAFTAEINHLYDTLESYSTHGDVPEPSEWDTITTSSWLSALVRKWISDGPLDVDTDIFTRGCDSLSATYIRNTLTSTLRSVQSKNGSKGTIDVPQEFVYMYPTINKMTAAVLAQLDPTLESAPTISQVDAIRTMIDLYSADIPSITPPENITPSTQNLTIVVTGTTGGLGSDILAKLLHNDAVGNVYALNRPSSSGTIEDRQLAAFRNRGLDQECLTSSKLTLVASDTSAEQCGLSNRLYNEILDKVDVVIHNAWKLDFNQALSAFEPHVRATRRLLDLVLASPRAGTARVLFTSSIAAVQGWDRSRGPCPEESFDDPHVAVGTGYGASKYVAEQVLLRARQQGVNTTSFRIGQITGNAENGAWALTDWVPIMIKSSVTMGHLPSTPGVISWLSSDSVAQLILDAARFEPGPDAVVNVVHPHAIQFDAVMDRVNIALANNGVVSEPLPTTDFKAWVDKLEKIGVDASSEDMRTIPALKLIPFFRGVASGDKQVDGDALGLAKLHIENAFKISQVFKSQPSLDVSLTDSWVVYWKERGLFD